MPQNVPLEVRVSVDVGCHRHSVAIGLSDGKLLDEFDIVHQPEGFHGGIGVKYAGKIQQWQSQAYFFVQLFGQGSGDRAPAVP